MKIVYQNQFNINLIQKIAKLKNSEILLKNSKLKLIKIKIEIKQILKNKRNII